MRDEEELSVEIFKKIYNIYSRRDCEDSSLNNQETYASTVWA